MKKLKKLGSLLLIVLLLAAYVFLQPSDNAAPETVSESPVSLETQRMLEEPAAPHEEDPAPPEAEEVLPDEDGEYTSKEDVAAYLHTYGKLPGNFITKKQAQKLGWEGGDLWQFAKGKSIGGDRFGNYEGLLPEDKDYKECDIDYHGGKRGGKRIVFSPDGFIYYTGDHYESFELLYGEE